MPWTDIFAAWGTLAEDDWRAHVDALTVETIYYSDPHSGPVAGREPLKSVIAEFRQMMPGGSAAASKADGYAGHERAAVTFMKDGASFMTGQYVAELDSAGRLTRLIGFSSMPKT